jgi:hypothetical protein
MRKTRHRRQLAAQIAPLLPLPATVASELPSRTDALHVHGRGYLARGSVARCGCDIDVLAGAACATGDFGAASWVPVRSRHVGYVRTHFIYSDRMPFLIR